MASASRINPIRDAYSGGAALDGQSYAEMVRITSEVYAG